MTIQSSTYPVSGADLPRLPRELLQGLYHSSEIIGGQILHSSLSHALFRINVEGIGSNEMMVGCSTSKDPQLHEQAFKQSISSG